jgi:subtilisin family serine protease
MMKKISFLLMVLVWNLSISQTNNNTIDYIVVMKEGFNLEYNQKSIRDGGYYSFELQNNQLKRYINSNPIYEIKKEFPTSRTPYLQRAYRVSTNSDDLLNSLINRNEIEYAEKYHEPQTLNLPNDFNIPIDGERNTALDLIRAPMAWGITTGSSNVIVGIADGDFEISHEDIDSQIILNLNANVATSTMHGNHGTQVAGMFAKTNNNIGSSSVGYNTKIAITTGLSVQKLLLLSQQPNVRVVNASWLSTCSFSPIENAVIQEIINGTEVTPPVVVVAAAGNIKTCGNFTNYIYPASYPRRNKCWGY